MAKSYRPWDPTQTFLLPPSPMEWLPENHLAYFVLDLCAELDLRAIERVLQERDPRGERPYSPRMMTSLLLYAYAVGIFSSRKIEKATFEHVAFRMLAAGEHPHFTTINEFRARHRQALAELFIQVLKECQRAGLVKLGHVAIDGSKIKANASKHKAMSYDRMKTEEQRLAAEVEQLLAQAEATDAAEDNEHGVGKAPQDLPAELVRREDRLATIRATRAALEREAAAARATTLREQADELRTKAEDPDRSPQKRAEAATLAKKRDQQADALDDDDRDPPPAGPDDDVPRNSPPTTKDGTPVPSAQRNFTDPDSKIMHHDGAFTQAYNAQLAVDEEKQIIVATTVSNQCTDAGQFVPVLRRVVANCDAVPARTTADAGYISTENVRAAENMGTEPFISVGKQRNDGSQAREASCPGEKTPVRLAMRAVLQTEQGKAAYARRKATVEPVFGQIKACRGFRQFSFRGLWKNRCEWAFVCLTHNLLKLFRAGSRSLPAAA
jgi:transposase